MTSWDGLSWSAPIIIAAHATLAKAIVDSGTFYVVWSYINPSANEWGKYIGLLTGDGTAWTDLGEIASWTGATNWDPVLIKDRDTFRLFWAPDTAGPEGQFIATSTSKTPTVSGSWSAPVRATTASYGTENWWDFWPEPFKRGSTYLFYTSERNSDGTAMTDGNIWVYMAVPLTS